MPGIRLPIFVHSIAIVLFGCSGGGGTGGMGAAGTTGGAGGSGGPGPGGLVYKPCEGERVGLFTLDLKNAMSGAPAFTQFGGALRDKIDPNLVWPTKTTEGECKLKVGPKLSCAPACTNLMICLGQNQCAPPPVNQSAGDITITGLAASLTAMALGNGVYSTSLPTSTAFPPAAPGAAVAFAAAGAGSVAAFSLKGSGITPLVVPDAVPMILKTPQPVTITWTPPAAAGVSKILFVLDIAHHGGLAAELECDFPDTGSATLSSSILTALLAEGTAGFPTYTLTRRTVDSTAAGSGCVEFAVASTIEREIMVEGVTSCNGERPCPTGQTCGVDLKCS